MFISFLHFTPMATLVPSSPSSFPALRTNPRPLRTLFAASCIGSEASAKIPVPPINPKDPFLSKLASVVAKSPETFLNRPVNPDTSPYLDVFDVHSYGHSCSIDSCCHRACRCGADVLAMDGSQRTNLYVHKFNTTQDDGELIHIVAVGTAIGQACLLLAAGSPGKRFMMPDAKAMIQQPLVPSSGLMPASDVLIHARESEETVANVMKRPFYMDSTRAREFGVIDEILWRGQERIMSDFAP